MSTAAPSYAFLGTSDFAVQVLRAVETPPALVVSRPDRPKGRGRRLASPPVAEYAREAGLALEQPEDVHTLDLSSFGDVVVCAFGVWIKEPLISHPGLINIHPSLLPRWRGAAPIERAIMAGDRETGTCLMKVVEELDAGDVCATERTAIADDHDFGALSTRLAVLSAGLLDAWLRGERGGCAPQSGEMTYAEKIVAADRALDPARTAAENARVVRALSPHIGAKAGDLGVWRARPADRPAPAGEIAVAEGRVLWGCAGGALELLEVQPPGKARMDAAAYARGR